MRILFVGDVHAEASDLADCQALLDYVLKIANQEHPDAVVFTGDQSHTHSLIHVDILRFWKDNFERLIGSGCEIIALVGNHDKEVTENHSMLPYSGYVSVVSSPVVLNNILFVPFMNESEPEKFVEVCGAHPHIHTVVCHQTFFGSYYGSGFYAKDGINPDLIPQQSIVSGHIHTQQEFGKVFYTGSPRWRTLTDANQDRFLWMVEFDGEGKVLTKTGYSTASVCRQVFSVTLSPDSPKIPKMEAKDRWRITVKGSADFVEAKRKELALSPVRPQIQAVPDTVKSTGQVSESDGIDVAFKKFSGRYVPKYKTPVDELLTLVRERIGV